MKKVVCFLLVCLILCAVACAQASTLEDFTGTWTATSLSFAGQVMDANAAGFDMKIAIEDTTVTLSSTVMGIPDIPYTFTFDEVLSYSEGSSTQITISYVDADTINLNMIVEGMSFEFVMKRADGASGNNVPVNDVPGIVDPEKLVTAEDADTVKDKLIIDAAVLKDGDVCVFATNSSNTTIDELSLQILYKNKKGEIIDTDKDGHDVILPGHTVVSVMDAPKSYDSYEVSTNIELGCHPSYENHSDHLTVAANNGDKCIIVTITNNDEVEIEEIEYIVVFYNKGVPVDASSAKDVYHTGKGETVVEKVYEPSKKIKYDDFKVFINQAHTFGLW